MFPCIYMLNFYDSVGRDALEVVVLYCSVLRARLNLRDECEHNHTLILFMQNDRLFKKTGFYLWDVIFKFKHEGNFLHRNHK